jgi:hypothetical protein
MSAAARTSSDHVGSGATRSISETSAASFVRFKSPLVSAAVKVSVTSPMAWFGSIKMVNAVIPPAARELSVQITVCPDWMQAGLLPEVTSVIPARSSVLTVTPVAVCGPAFVTLSEYDNCPEPFTLPVAVTATSEEPQNLTRLSALTVPMPVAKSHPAIDVYAGEKFGLTALTRTPVEPEGV